MRRVISVVCVLLLLFNVVGYYGLFFGLQLRNDSRMSQRLDNDSYDTSQEITIKLPITIPYASDSTGFERVHGEFQYKGDFYRLVKQRLEKDTLYVVCIKDHQRQRIDRAWVTYVKALANRPADNGTAPPVHYVFGKDYLAVGFSISPESTGWERDVACKLGPTALIHDYYSSLLRPPQLG